MPRATCCRWFLKSSMPTIKVRSCSLHRSTILRMPLLMKRIELAQKYRMTSIQVNCDPKPELDGFVSVSTKPSCFVSIPTLPGSYFLAPAMCLRNRLSLVPGGTDCPSDRPFGRSNSSRPPFLLFLASTTMWCNLH